MLIKLIFYEFKRQFRSPASIIQPVFFVLITIFLFVIALGSNKALLSSVSIAIIWVNSLFAILLSSDQLFKDDHDDGNLEQFQLAKFDFMLIVAVKIVIHWLKIIVPLLIMSPIYVTLLYAPNNSLELIVLTLLLGTPTILLFSVLGNVLTINLRQGNLILGLIVMPLYVPVIVISLSAFNMMQINQPYTAQLALLAAMLLASLVVCLFAICAALKINN